MRQHTSSTQPIAVPTTRFSHIHVDLVGPHPSFVAALHPLSSLSAQMAAPFPPGAVYRNIYALVACFSHVIFCWPPW
jgi:hypothetical protein